MSGKGYQWTLRKREPWGILLARPLGVCYHRRAMLRDAAADTCIYWRAGRL